MRNSIQKHIKSVLLILAVFVPCTALVAQSEFGGFENIGKREGLLHTRTTCVFKDSKDFIWIGSSDGLMRYDGVLFDVFRRSKQDTIALSDNTITCIIEDRESYVFWVGTLWGGINRVDITKNDFKHYYLPQKNNEKNIPVGISCMYQLLNGNILIGTNIRGLYIFSPQTGEYRSLDELPDIRVYDIVEGDSFLWVLTAKGIMCLDKYNGTFQTDYDINGEFYKISHAKKQYNRIRGLSQRKDGNIYFTIGSRFYCHDLKSNEVRILFKEDSNVVLVKVIPDHLGNFWITSLNSGLFYYDLKSKKVSNYTFNIQNPLGSIPSDKIKDACFIPEQKIVFFATDKGISKYDYHKNLFRQFDTRKLTDRGVKHLSMVYKDFDGGYWFSVKSGDLYYKSRKDKEFKLIENTKARFIYQAFQFDSSDVYFATDKGLLVYDFNSRLINKLPIKGEEDLKNVNFLKGFQKAKEEACWLLSNAGLIHFKRKTKEFQFYPPDKDIIDKRFGRLTGLCYEPDSSALWFTSRSGSFYRFDLTLKSYQKIDVDYKSIESQYPLVVTDIVFDKHGKLWVSTFGKGLLIFDPQANILSEELAIEELESYSYALVYDAGKDQMWVTTNFGITRINTLDYSLTSFNERDGTFCEVFNRGVGDVNVNGDILFGGLNGFVEFNPDYFHINKYDKPVVINAWSKGAQTSVVDSEIYEDIIYLNDTSVSYLRSKGKVSFYASFLNYSHSFRNKMKWMLQGYNNSWQEGYPAQALSYSNLKPGEYVLKVKGYNSHGVESKKETRLYINVRPRYYETYLFRIFLVLLFITILYLIFRVRIAWYRNQKELLLEVVVKKTKEISDTNKELEESREEVIKQKTELEIHRNYLEDLVELRTKDLEDAKTKAEESDRLKTAFLANLSHEIRTPMNAIIGFSSILQTEEFEVDQQRNFLQVIGQSSESLLALIDDIIDISRIETGNVKIVKDHVHIPDLIKETLNELIFEDKSDDVDFVQLMELKPEDVTMITDRYRLKQVISNLIRNALKFTKEGHIHLTVKSSDKDELTQLGFELGENHVRDFNPVLFMVEDTGIGIDKEDLKIIFHPFQKAKRNQEVYKGMGLGLSIVHNIIKLLQGQVIVESEFNKGTVFKFYINAFPEIN